jgi:hypothetical protein
VWERDGGQCGFVGETGNRCPARARLEFDHVDPVARGGEATVEGIRLRCRAHNQYEAECVFGAGFMSDKRAEARVRAETRKQAKARAAAVEQSPASATEPATDSSNDRDVAPYLRKLGCSAVETRRVAALCESIPNASLEERVRFALKHLMPPHRRVAACPATAP